MVTANTSYLEQRTETIRRSLPQGVSGRVSGLAGLTVEAEGFAAPLGAQCRIYPRSGDSISARVIGFRGHTSILMPLDEMTGIAGGDRVLCESVQVRVPLGQSLLGRVINGCGEPIDGKGPLLCSIRRGIEAESISPLRRARIDTPLGTGIRAIDAMLTCACGQRMGIFSGAGVGKSVLLGMIARYTSADVTVICLVGERGREVREFLEKDLGRDGLKRSVVVVSTSDEPEPIRVQAAFVAATVAEYFRDQGRNVLMLMDSITRVAMAQRQIGLSMGEPPATKGFTPSVFALFPRLLERCGRSETGSITGFFTVLVEGDDFNEPISDVMRGILDGHLWLSRDLANRGHYPAIDVLGSISRVMADVTDAEHQKAVREIIRLMAVYRDIQDLVNIGAYAAGTNAEYDLAIGARNGISQFLCQSIDERANLAETIQKVKSLANSLRAQGKAAPAGAR